MKLIPKPIQWRNAKSGSVIFGSANRSVLFGAMGPRHEVNIGYDFQISEAPVSVEQVRNLQERLGAELASESEWELAYSQGLLIAEEGEIEVFPDSANSYWGKKCDGRPFLKGSKFPQISREWKDGKPTPSLSRPSSDSQSDFPELSSDCKVRLVVRNQKKWSEKSPKLPEYADTSRIIGEEILISLIVGIIPSFAWAYYNAAPSYLAEGWINLTLGGLFIGILSGLFWRPLQPTWIVIEGKMSSSHKD